MTVISMVRRVFSALVLIIVGALVVLAAVWLPSQFQGYIGWLLSAVIIFLSALVAWLIWRIFRLEKQAKGKNKQSTQGEKAADPDAVSASQNIKAALDGAVKRLRENNRDIYGLPWFLMLGGRNTGKTTLLRYWGLVQIHTPVVDAADQYCQFWCSAELLVIRIDGDLFEAARDNKDKSPWNQLLQRILYHRPRCPLNGILCIEGMEHLAAADPRLSETDAAYMRLRLGEISHVLGQSLPAWVLVTAADRLMDFAASFTAAHLGETESLFGGLVPVHSGHLSPGFDGNWFASHWQGLLKMLSQRQLHMIQEEPRRENWASLITLPVQLNQVGSKLARFLSMVFSKHPLQAPVWFRGYFLLALGGEAKQDPLGQSCSHRYNLLTAAPLATEGQYQPLFTAGLLDQVIVPEAWRAGYNRKNVRLWGLLRSGYWLLLALILGLGITWSILNIEYERRQRSQLLHAVTEWHSQADTLYVDTKGGRQENTAHTTLSAILASLEQLRQIALQIHQVRPWYVVIWPALTNSEQAVETTWLNARKRLLLPKLDALLKEQLQQALTADQRPAVFEWLGLYLMFHSPVESDLFRLQNRIINLVQRHSLLSEHSTQALLTQLSGLTPADLHQAIDENLVAQARKQISGVPTADMGLLLLEQRPVLGARIPVNDLLGRDFFDVFRLENSATQGKESIPLLYTRDGFSRLDFTQDSHLIAELFRDIRRIEGITEPASPLERADFAMRLRQAYAVNYINQWQALLDQVSLSPVNSLDDLLQLLTLLQRSTASPLLAVVRNVAEGTTLAQSEESQGEESAGDAPVQPSRKVSDDDSGAASHSGQDSRTVRPHITPLTETVSNAFYGWRQLATNAGSEGSSIKQFTVAAGALRQALQQAAATGDSRQALYTMAVEHAQGSGPLYSITAAASALPDPSGRWVEELADHAWKLVLKGAHEWIAQQWREQVVSVYQQTLHGRFPFQSNADREAGLVDFATFFSPSGVLNSFLKTYLEPFIDLSRGGTPRIMGGYRIQFSRELADVVHRMGQFQRVLFSGDAGKLGLKIRIQARSLSANATELRLSAAQGVYRYQHGPRLWYTFEWPGADPDSSVDLEFFNGKLLLAQTRFYGAWAWLRLFHAGGLKPRSDTSHSSYETRLNLKDYKTRLWVDLPGIHESIGQIFIRFKMPVNI